MIIVLKQGTTQQEIDTVTNAVVARGVSVSPIVGTEMTILGLTGDTSRIDPDQLESFHCVERIMKVAEPFKKANRAFHPAPSEIKIGNTVVGGKKLAIIAQNRFRQPISNLKKLLDSGLAGKVLCASVTSAWWRGHCYYDLWWRGTWEKEGGGCTLNHAVHHIDMLCWMMGLPQTVTSVMANVAHDNAEVEDLSLSVLQYPGALAQLTASVVHHGEDQELIFQCEKAKVAAPFSVYASISKPNGFPIENTELEQKIRDFVDAQPQLPYEGHAGELENVLSALEKDTLPAIGGEDGRRTIELITAIYKSGATKQTVTLPLQKDDPFYTVEGMMRAVPHFYEKTTSAASLDGTITLGSDYQQK